MSMSAHFITEKLIQPDVGQALTLPSNYYFDPAVEPAEKEKIFARTWQIVGHIRQLPKPGSFFTTELAGEPLLIARNAVGDIKGFYNVCKHRAGPPAQGCGERKVFRCGYHGWTYSLDGDLLNAPECEGVQDFRRQDFGLTPVRIEEWSGLIFVNLNPKAEPLRKSLGKLPEQAARFQLERMQLHERRIYEMECNWKTYIDNYLEAITCPACIPDSIANWTTAAIPRNFFPATLCNPAPSVALKMRPLSSAVTHRLKAT